MDIENDKSGDIEVGEAIKKYDEDKRFTYEDYASWGDDARYELIDGVAYMMSAPSMTHQKISMEFSRQLSTFLTGKSCKVFAAPCDVCLNGKGRKDEDVVQPDIIVVCDDSKIEENFCNGAPDMAIEILSPSTSKMDLFVKLKKYHQTGVREYWITDPVAKTVSVHILQDGQYKIDLYESHETIAVTVLDGCVINLADVFG